MENAENTPSPSQRIFARPAPKAGFRFLTENGDKSQTMKYVDYRPARIYRGEAKWHVEYAYRDPSPPHDFIRFKVYENINRIKDLKDKEEFAKKLKDAVNFHLDKGFNPFEEELKIVIKNWTVVQGLNYFKTKPPLRIRRKRTKQTYGSVLKFLYAYLPMNVPIKEVSKVTVNSAFRKAYQEKGWSNVTFNNYVTFTKAIWNYLISEEITDKNPVVIESLPEEIKRHKHFSKEDFAIIKKEAEPDHFDYMLFIYHTGSRPQEIDEMTDENFLWDKKLIYIPSKTSKVTKGRYIPMSDYIIEKYKKIKGRVFKFSKSHYSAKFAELRKRLKLDKDYTNYAMKHTRAAHLAEDNVNIYVIMQFLGHSNPRTTMKYIRELGVNINREAVEKGIKF